jgi:pyrroline-5-carboxylate reductase
MGEAIIAGLVRSGVRPGEILAYDADSSRLGKVRKDYSIRALNHNPELIRGAEVVILAVKPQVMEKVLAEIGPAVKAKKPLVISIAAGIKTETIKARLGRDSRLARVMPNTPALIGAGISAYFAAGMEKSDKAKVEKILSAIGQVVEVEKEELMDAVTGLSGSGPAYIFMVIEALADGGVKVGLARKMALQLAAQTVIGAGRMVLETGMHPGELKDMVTSPGGTTIAGLSALEQGGLRGLLIKAVESATMRSRELAGGASAKPGPRRKR